MKSINTIIAVSLVATIFFVVPLFVTPLSAGAGAIEFNSAASIKDILVLNKSKRMTVVLDSGTKFTGNVTKVGQNLVYLRRPLHGGKFNNVLILINRISAVEID